MLWKATRRWHRRCPGPIVGSPRHLQTPLRGNQRHGQPAGTTPWHLAFGAGGHYTGFPPHTQLQGALGPMSGHQYGGPCLFGRASWQSELNDGLGTGSFQEQLFNGPLLSSHLSSLLVNTGKHVSGESLLLFYDELDFLGNPSNLFLLPTTFVTVNLESHSTT